MAILVSNETYSRLIFDSDDIEALFKVDGQEVSLEDVAELVENGGKLEIDQRIKEDAKPITVTFRPLRSVDKTAIEDTISMTYGEGGGRMAPGSMRRLAIRRAVVKWDYEVPFTENTLDNLDPTVFEQLYGWISWGVAPPEQNPESGLPLEEEEPAPNRAQRRAAAKTKTKTEAKVEPSPEPLPESEDASTETVKTTS